MHPKLSNLHAYLETLTSRADLHKLSGLLAELKIHADELADETSFSETTYKRNKLASSDWYDLLLMCWRSGQATKIHDHTASSCAFKILKGVATETRFERIEGVRGQHGYVSAIGAPRDYKCGQICAAQDQEIHRIANDQLGEDLITLHIYSPPLQMAFYEVDTTAASGLAY
jgi:cysteine dioxygenase